MDRKKIDKIIKNYLKDLSENIHIDKAILFGSSLTGRLERNKDIDLLILSSSFEKMDDNQRFNILYTSRKNWETQTTPMDIFGLTPREYAEADFLSITGEIKEKGKELAFSSWKMPWFFTGQIFKKIKNNIKKIKLAVSIAGFYKDEGWNCVSLFSENYDWKKIKKQADKICLIWSEDDPYITKEQTDYLANKLGIKPIILPHKQHFSLSSNPKFKQFPELLELIKNNFSWL